MATYLALPPVPKIAAADTTGMNAGNYTAWFMASDFRATAPYFEVNRITITGGTVLSTITVYVGTQLFDVAVIGFAGLTSWSARNPMQLMPGIEVKILFGITVAGNTAPQVTLWPRFDIDIPANQANQAG